MNSRHFCFRLILCLVLTIHTVGRLWGTFKDKKTEVESWESTFIMSQDNSRLTAYFWEIWFYSAYQSGFQKSVENLQIRETPSWNTLYFKITNEISISPCPADTESAKKKTCLFVIDTVRIYTAAKFTKCTRLTSVRWALSFGYNL